MTRRSKIRDDDRQQVNLRLPNDVIARAEALVPIVAQNKLLSAALRVTPVTVLRIALMYGLEMLEKESEK